MSHILICAMDSEAEGFRNILSDRVDETVGGLTFSSGLFCGHPVVVVKCGVGKVNAARCAQTALLRYHPKAVINVGVAGGGNTGCYLKSLKNLIVPTAFYETLGNINSQSFHAFYLTII